MMADQGNRFQRGFSLIEVMVGLVIGLLATLVIMQVYATFEGQKRTTTGSSDAQTSGTLALYSIQRDAGNAGFGLPVADSTANAFNCPVGTVINQPGLPALDIFPVQVTDGGAGAGNSDSVAFRFGSGDFNMSAAVTKITSVSGTTVNVSNSLACAANNIGLVINGSLACDNIAVTAVPSATQLTVSSVPSSAIVGASVACLGAATTAATPGAWNENLYSVDNTKHALVLAQNGAVTTTPIASDIVNMQVQYGVSATGTSDTITQWVDATGIWATPSLANRNRIKAIRIAIVTRNGQLEKNVVTNACSSTTSAAPTGLCAWAGDTTSPAPAINLTNLVDGTGATNWQNYRYRVFSAIIPLRSMIWSGGN